VAVVSVEAGAVVVGAVAAGAAAVVVAGGAGAAAAAVVVGGAGAGTLTVGSVAVAAFTDAVVAVVVGAVSAAAADVTPRTQLTTAIAIPVAYPVRTVGILPSRIGFRETEPHPYTGAGPGSRLPA
jgi:hypothetical protein